jgi:hypothetical protein
LLKKFWVIQHIPKYLMEKFPFKNYNIDFFHASLSAWQTPITIQPEMVKISNRQHLLPREERPSGHFRNGSMASGAPLPHL